MTKVAAVIKGKKAELMAKILNGVDHDIHIEQGETKDGKPTIELHMRSGRGC
jgi:hypothetical protein